MTRPSCPADRTYGRNRSNAGDRPNGASPARTRRSSASSNPGPGTTLAAGTT